MAKSITNAKRDEQADLDRLFERADKQWERGRLKSAFRLYLAGAKAGDPGSQLNLGNFYSDGIGVKPNPLLALYWYRRAYRQGYGAAASNIGLLFREQGKLKHALQWFERAARLKDGDAKLEIAKILLLKNEQGKALRYLRQTCRAKTAEITEASRKEGERLLKSLTEAVTRR